jgi:hypothetical protein
MRSNAILCIHPMPFIPQVILAHTHSCVRLKCFLNRLQRDTHIFVCCNDFIRL